MGPSTAASVITPSSSAAHTSSFALPMGSSGAAEASRQHARVDPVLQQQGILRMPSAPSGRGFQARYREE